MFVFVQASVRTTLGATCYVTLHGVCFRYLLGDPDLCMDFDQEMKLLKERQEIVQRVGLHAGLCLGG